jgi:hypothetical protein
MFLKTFFTLPFSKIPTLKIEKKIVYKKNELENQKSRFFYSKISSNPNETTHFNSTDQTLFPYFWVTYFDELQQR